MKLSPTLQLCSLNRCFASQSPLTNFPPDFTRTQLSCLSSNNELSSPFVSELHSKRKYFLKRLSSLVSLEFPDAPEEYKAGYYSVVEKDCRSADLINNICSFSFSYRVIGEPNTSIYSVKNRSSIPVTRIQL